ncbi:hypothetical protein L7F22_025628 [Adiantum nelumboides]|nr:hypothetical protein [Adiantum nelumboides]
MPTAPRSPVPNSPVWTPGRTPPPARRRQRRLRAALRPRLPDPGRRPRRRADPRRAGAQTGQRPGRRARRGRRATGRDHRPADAAGTGMSSFSTHVLDAAAGRPATGVPVTLTGADGTVLASGTTDDDGRWRARSPPRSPRGCCTGSRSRRRARSSRRCRSRSARSAPTATTTSRCCCRPTPTPPTSGADHVRLGPPRRQQVRQGGGPRGAGRARHRPARDHRPQRDQPAAGRRPGEQLPDRRQLQGRRHRHPEERGVRLRLRARDHLARGVPAAARRPLHRRVRLDHRRALAGRAVRVGADRRRRRRARPLVRPEGPGHPAGDGAEDRRRHPRHRRAEGPHRAEVHRQRVPRLPARPLHDPRRDRRPHPRHLGHRALALPARRRRRRDRLQRRLRRDRRRDAVRVRHHPLARAAAVALRDGPGRDRGLRRRRRDPVRDAQQAPLPVRPVAVRPQEPERGLPRRRPPLRPDRGHRRPRRRDPGAGGVDRRRTARDRADDRLRRPAHPRDVRRRDRGTDHHRRCGRAHPRAERRARRLRAVHQRARHPAADPRPAVLRIAAAAGAGHLVRLGVDDDRDRRRRRHRRPAHRLRRGDRRGRGRASHHPVLRPGGTAVPAGGDRVDHHRDRAVVDAGGDRLDHRPGDRHRGRGDGTQPRVRRAALDRAGRVHLPGGGRRREDRGALAAVGAARSAGRDRRRAGGGLSDFSGVGGASVAALPAPFAFGTPLFTVGATVSMVIVVLVIMVETTADILAVGEVVETRVDARRVGDGLRADMAASVVAPVFNSFPATAFAQNVGLVALTGIRSRFAVAAGGLLLLVLGLSPMASAVFSAIPQPVLGGAGIVLFGTVAASGIRTLAAVEYRGTNNMVIVAASVAFGLVPVVSPDFWANFPDWFATIFHSGISSAAIVAVLLNLFFNVFAPAGRRRRRSSRRARRCWCRPGRSGSWPRARCWARSPTSRSRRSRAPRSGTSDRRSMIVVPEGPGPVRGTDPDRAGRSPLPVRGRSRCGGQDLTDTAHACSSAKPT